MILIDLPGDGNLEAPQDPRVGCLLVERRDACRSLSRVDGPLDHEPTGGDTNSSAAPPALGHRGSGTFRSAERRPAGRRAPSSGVDTGGKRRPRRAHRGPLRRARVWALGVRDTQGRAFRRVRWPFSPVLRGVLHSVRRDRMAPCCGILGPWLRHGGSTGCADIRFRDARARRDRIVHGAAQPSLPSRDGEDRHGPQPGQRLRSSLATRGASPSATCSLQDGSPGAAQPRSLRHGRGWKRWLSLRLHRRRHRHHHLHRHHRPPHPRRRVRPG